MEKQILVNYVIAVLSYIADKVKMAQEEVKDMFFTVRWEDYCERGSLMNNHMSILIGVFVGFFLGLAVPVIISLARSYASDRRRKRTKSGKDLNLNAPKLIPIDED